jgi:hypothetical protein
MAFEVVPAYLPNLAYMSCLIKHEQISFINSETYQKKSFRNRTVIYGANGVLRLTIPITHRKKKKLVDKDVEIFNTIKWQKSHWKSICSAYRSSPYFEFYQDEFISFYKYEKNKLTDFNIELIIKILKLLDHKFDYKVLYSNSSNNEENRCLINSKEINSFNFPSYTQVFSNKNGFIKNLSILDLIFNLGPNSNDYLLNINK